MDTVKFDDYSNRFNLLSDKIVDAGIDISLLMDLLKAYENLPECYKNIKD